MKNAAYAALTAQGYLPTSKTDRMAVVDIVVDAVMADLRAEVMALRDEHHDGPVGRNRCVRRVDVLALLGGHR